MGKKNLRGVRIVLIILTLGLCFQNCSPGFASRQRSFSSISKSLLRTMAVVSGRATRIMPLGDSITFGYSSADPTAAQGGYRTTMYAGLPGGVQLVGSQMSGPASLPQRSHEGHPGFTIANVSDGVEGWLNANPADIILLHLGTNDFVQNASTDAADHLGGLMDKIMAKSPGSTLVVASIIDIGISWYDNSALHAYNSRVQSIVAQKAAAGSPILFVDMNSAISSAAGSGDYDADGIHPSAQGYQKMGARWAGVVRQILGTETVTGVLDNVTDNGLIGWACAVGGANSVRVNVYSGGPAGTGTSVASVVATSPSEDSINQLCHGGGPYRFKVGWPRGSRVNHQGETLFVYAVLPEGGFEVPLDNSGTVLVPAPPADPSTVVNNAPPVAIPIAVAPVAAPVVAAPASPVTSAPSSGAAPLAAPVATPFEKAVVYRFIGPGGAHLYTRNGDPNSQPNFTLEGPAFNVFTQNYPGTIALWRCSQGPLHFMSIDSSCEASTVLGVIGYIYPNPVDGMTSLYRFNNSDWRYTLESTNLSESGGYQTITTLGSSPPL